MLEKLSQTVKLCSFSEMLASPERVPSTLKVWLRSHARGPAALLTAAAAAALRPARSAARSARTPPPPSPHRSSSPVALKAAARPPGCPPDK